MVRRGLAQNRTQARAAIQSGIVTVTGIPEPKPATMVDHAISIRLQAPARRFVSRGGEKLDGVLDVFGVDVDGLRCVDVGASTGGFTDCLLQRGAAAVTAVDVGYGQLAWSLTTDNRVTVVDRTNIRHAEAMDLGAPFDLVVADLSFISLRTVAPALARLGRSGTQYVLLVKPQFEVGRGNVARGGIVRDVDAVRRAFAEVLDALDGVGIGVTAAAPSPITGAKGNQEYLVHGTLGSPLDRAAAMEGLL